jgi:hypothetical protein
LFLPIYTKNILSKQNPRIYDIKKSLNKDKKYLHLCIYQNDIYVGGCILGVGMEKSAISFCFKSMPSEKKGINLNLTLLSEYFVFQKTLELKIKSIFHGADRNLYGENNNIGLSIYKLSVGHHPVISLNKGNEIIKYTWKQDKNVFGFVCDHNSEKGTKLTSAVLFLNENLDEIEMKNKYGLLLNNPYFKTTVIFDQK